MERIAKECRVVMTNFHKINCSNTKTPRLVTNETNNYLPIARGRGNPTTRNPFDELSDDINFPRTSQKKRPLKKDAKMGIFMGRK
jgi:hypothetical protein